MNWGTAKDIASRISQEEMIQMLINAKNGIKDWTAPCKTNKGLSWGTAWNVMVANGGIKERDFNTIPLIVKIQLLRLFGDWLPEYLQPPKKKKIKSTNPTHQEPNFTNW
jgi:hypothetical protein